MTPEEQLRGWAYGHPVHSELGCCPDMSCCHPSLLAPVRERQLFIDRPELQMLLLAGFLLRARIYSHERGYPEVLVFEDDFGEQHPVAISPEGSTIH